MTHAKRLGLGLLLICSTSQQAFCRFGGYDGLGYALEQRSPGLQRAEEITELLKAIQNIERQRDQMDAGNDDAKNSLDRIINNLRQEIGLLSNPENLDAKMGRAALYGLAGKDIGELFRGEKVGSLAEGVKLGAAARLAGALGTVGGTLVEKTVGTVISAPCENFLAAISEVSTAINNLVWHGGHAGFTASEIQFISNLTNRTLTDLNTMLRDSLKDMMRGQDTTLRLAEEQPENNHRNTGWKTLTDMYSRQIDSLVDLIKLRLPHYNAVDQIAKNAHEVIRCLEDIKKLFVGAQTLRELDDRLESNKSVLTAIKGNAQVWLTRLQELVEPKRVAGSDAMGATKSARGSLRGSQDDDDDFPHGFKGGY